MTASTQAQVCNLQVDTTAGFLFTCTQQLPHQHAVQTTVRLRGALPVVVDADFWEDTGEALDDIFIPDAEVW